MIVVLLYLRATNWHGLNGGHYKQFLCRDHMDYNSMSGEQFSALTPDIIAAFTYDHRSIMTTEHVIWLRNEQIEALQAQRNGPRCYSLWGLNAQKTPLLRTENLKLVLSAQLAWKSGVDENFISYLTPDQIRYLPLDYLAFFFTRSALRLLNQEQFDALTAEQISVLDDRGMEIVENGRTVLSSSNSFSPPQTNSNQRRPQSPRFPGSEAEVLKQQLRIRITENRFLNQVQIHGENVDIWQPPYPHLRHYTFIDQEFAESLGFPVNTAVSETQIQDLSLADLFRIFEASSNHSLLHINDFGEENPLYNSREVSPDDQTKISSIRERIDQAITRLNQADPSGYFVSSDLYESPCLYRNSFHLGSFLSLMRAIETDNEEEFVESMIRLATAFRQNRLNGKRGLIDAFTHLYVTKEFSSEGTRQWYFHFILRSGEMF